MVQQSNDPLIGLLGALLGGNPNVQSQLEQSGQSMDQVLGTLSSGPATSGQSAGGDVLGSILGSMMGGGAPAQSGGGDVLGSILGSMMSGGATPSGMPAQTGGDVLGSILGSMMGGGAPQGGTPSRGMPTSGADPLGAILGGLLGGGMQSGGMGSNAFLAPIIEAIANKLGIDPKIAQTIVTFALNALMSGALGGGNQQFDSAGLVARVSSGKPVTQKYLKESGLLSALTAQTGLDQKTAAKSLQQVFQAFSTQMGDGSYEDHQRQFNTLVGNWNK